MNVLVIGGAGYIGSHIVLELIQNNYKVLVFDDLSSGNEENIDSQASFYNGSLLSQNDLEKIFSNKIDVVIHLAAFKAAGESMVNPSKYLNNNVIGTSNLLIACQKFNIKNFIFSSTAAVYGNPQYLPIDEKHPKIPTNYYGESKLQIERNLDWFSRIYNFKYASLRYFNATGYDNQMRIRGLENNPQNLIPSIMEFLVGKRNKFGIYGDDYNTKDGTAIRDYIHVTDLARAHVLSIKYLQNKKKNLILNLGTEKGYSVYDVVKTTEKIINKKINFHKEPRRKGDIDILIADYKKAYEILNWKPVHSEINEIIQTTWNIYKLYL